MMDNTIYMMSIKSIIVLLITSLIFVCTLYTYYTPFYSITSEATSGLNSIKFKSISHKYVKHKISKIFTSRLLHQLYFR